MKREHLEVSVGPGEWCIVLLLGSLSFKKSNMDINKLAHYVKVG